MSELEDMVINLIPYGKENAISRSALVNATGMSDRLVRRAIADARIKNVILSNPKGGYYRPMLSDAAEIEAYIKQEQSRAKNCFKAIVYANSYLEDLKGGRFSG